MNEEDLNFLGLFRHETATIQLKPGQTLFSKGDAAKEMYVVKAGELSIGDGNFILETVEAGGIVGEMALIDAEPRSASVRAVTDCEVVPVDQKRFLLMIQQTPFFAVRVMRVMAHRIRVMNERLTQL